MWKGDCVLIAVLVKRDVMSETRKMGHPRGQMEKLDQYRVVGEVLIGVSKDEKITAVTTGKTSSEFCHVDI